MGTDANDQSDLTEVFSSPDLVQVEMAADILRESGIPAFVVNNDAARMLGSTPAVPARVMVSPAKVDEALEELRAANFEV